jgi:Helicase conserved C-terminal domain
MDQSDLDLLQIVPSYHVQTMMKSRHIPLSSLALNEGSPLGTGVLTSYPVAALQEIARYLFDPDALNAVLTNLEELPALILRELVSCGGRANSRDLALYFSCAGLLEPTKKTASPVEPAENPLAAANIQRIHHKIPPQPPQPPHYPPSHPHGTFEQALRQLLMLGLVFWGKQTNFAGRDYTSGVHDGVLIVPTPVVSVACTYWKLDEAPTYPLLPANSDDAATMSDTLESARALQRTLYLYWSSIVAQREGLSLLANGLLTRTSLKLIVDAMEEHKGQDEQGKETRFQRNADSPRSEIEVPNLYFLRLLLMQLGLLQVNNTTLKAASANAFFALPFIERMRRCYQLYLETPFWNELAFLPEINVRPGPAPLEPAYSEVMQARKAILERIRLEPVKEWRDIQSFIARTKLYIPYLLFPRQYGPRAERYSSGSNPYGWDFRLRRGWLTHREGWHMVEGGFIRAMVGGPLYWLGLVELDREEYPTQFRPLPALFLMLQDDDERFSFLEEQPGRLIVQPNFEVIALAPVSEVLLMLLDRFAERVSLDLVAHYKISKASITRAIQRGLRVEDIVRQLEQATGSELPQNVRYSLAEWERQARRIEIWQNKTLLEVDDELLLDKLLADEHYRTFFGRRLAPRLIEVLTNHLASVQTLFWQQNDLPALTVVTSTSVQSEDQQLPQREPQWQLHENGLLQPLYPVLDLYQATEAQRFCEVDEETSWYKLTSISIRKALKQGFELDAIVRFLRDSCVEGIPGSLLIRLKLWGGGYGSQNDLHIEHTPLLRLPTDIFQDLLTDEIVRPLLGDEVEQSYRLIRIDPANLERVLALLRERGFQVE